MDNVEKDRNINYCIDEESEVHYQAYLKAITEERE